MKKTLLFAAFLLAALGTFAQSYFRNPTGDTVVGRDTTYFYGQWYDTLSIPMYDTVDGAIIKTIYAVAHSEALLNGLRILNPIDSGFGHFDPINTLYDRGGDHVIGRELHTPAPIRVIGVAAAISGCQQAFYAVDSVTAHRFPEYLQLYQIYDGDPYLVDQGEWHLEDSHRYISLPGGDWHTGERKSFFPLYEVYFKNGYVVEDSFMVGTTCHNNAIVEEPYYGDGGPLVWKTIRNPTRVTYIENNINYNHPLRWAPGGEMLWYQETGHDFIRFHDTRWGALCIFPILDTGYVPPHVECPIVTDLNTRPIDESSLWIVWPDNPDHSRWQAVIGPVGTDPDSAQPRTSYAHYIRANDLVPDSQYVAYVRGWCDRDSSWGAWSNCLRFSINDSSANDSLDITSPQNIVDRFTSIFPNPAHGQATVYSSFGLRALAAFSLDGREMLRMPASGLSASFSTDHWPAGSYILQIRTPRGTAVKTLLVR